MRRSSLLVLLAMLAVALPMPVAAFDGGVLRTTLDDDGSERTRVMTLAPSSAVRNGATTSDARGVDQLAWWTSPELVTDDARLVAVQGVDANVEAAVRARVEGVWGEWMTLWHNHEEAPDEGSAEAEQGVRGDFSEPLHVGGADAIQVRVRGRVPSELSVHAIEVDADSVADDAVSSSGATAAQAEQHATGDQTGVDRFGVEAPSIGPRSSWGAVESLNRAAPVYADDVRFAVVHHTAGGNGYSRAQVPAILRSIHRFHVISRGWNDVAYNFLIDSYGGIWEGRAGGVTRAVVGGHAAGWNGGSVGISFLGNHDTAKPSAAALEALEELLAWKLDVHHVDPDGTTTEQAGGGSSNKHRYGSIHTFPTIIGHRTNNNTSCPGGNLYPHVVGGEVNGARVEGMAERLADRGDGPKVFGGLPPQREQGVLGPHPVVVATFNGTFDWGVEVRRVADADGVAQASEVVRSATGRGRGTTLRWDLTDATGNRVEAGTYELVVRARDGADQARPLTTTVEVRAASERLSGSDRIRTSIEMSRWAFDRAGSIVLAGSATYADALAATPLAGSLGAPVLLAPAGGLTPELVDEVERLGATRAYLVGGDIRLSPAIEGQLRALGVRTVVREAGANRYETAVDAARTVWEREGARTAIVALGSHPEERRAFPDALSAGYLGAAAELPLLLTEGGALPPITAEFLGNRSWDRIVLVGGTSAISDDVVDTLRVFVGASTRIERISGANRYDTSVAALRETERLVAARAAAFPADPNRQDTGSSVVLASGENWPDALGAASAAARKGASFLLTPPVALAPAAADAIGERAARLGHVAVAGGPAAMDDDVRIQAEGYVASAGPHTDSSPIAP